MELSNERVAINNIKELKIYSLNTFKLITKQIITKNLINIQNQETKIQPEKVILKFNFSNYLEKNINYFKQQMKKGKLEILLN